MDPRDTPRLDRRDFLAGTAAVATATTLLGTLDTGTAAATSRNSPSHPVRTQSGLVTGTPAALPGITVYKGIPYAASTAGPNRWRAPQPPASWRGVRKADTWGPACPQPVTGIAADKVPPLSEDCLNLNIWTGAGSSTRSRDLRPVFVWIYGGRNSAMWASQPVYDGANLAAKGAVVVTYNHRVGAFGNLAHPALSSEGGHGGSGNWGCGTRWPRCSGSAATSPRSGAIRSGSPWRAGRTARRS